MTNNLKPNTMKTTRYTPQPIDTSDVKLPIELKNLVEEMYSFTHPVYNHSCTISTDYSSLFPCWSNSDDTERCI